MEWITHLSSIEKRLIVNLGKNTYLVCVSSAWIILGPSYYRSTPTCQDQTLICRGRCISIGVCVGSDSWHLTTWTRSRYGSIRTGDGGGTQPHCGGPVRRRRRGRNLSRARPLPASTECARLVRGWIHALKHYRKPIHWYQVGRYDMPFSFQTQNLESL